MLAAWPALHVMRHLQTLLAVFEEHLVAPALLQEQEDRGEQRAGLRRARKAGVEGDSRACDHARRSALSSQAR